MFKKTAISFLSVLVLFISGAVYSQSNYGMYNQYYSNGPERAVSIHRIDITSASYYEGGLPDSEAASAVYLGKGDITGGNQTVTHRKYIRPSDTEKEEVYFKPMDAPVISSRTSTGVPPHGYNYYTEKSNIPIRDFRADMWKSNYYVAKFYKDESNDSYFGNVAYMNLHGSAGK